MTRLHLVTGKPVGFFSFDACTNLYVCLYTYMHTCNVYIFMYIYTCLPTYSYCIHVPQDD